MSVESSGSRYIRNCICSTPSIMIDRDRQGVTSNMNSCLDGYTSYKFNCNASFRECVLSCNTGIVLQYNSKMSACRRISILGDLKADI